MVTTRKKVTAKKPVMKKKKTKSERLAARPLPAAVDAMMTTMPVGKVTATLKRGGIRSVEIGDIDSYYFKLESTDPSIFKKASQSRGGVVVVLRMDEDLLHAIKRFVPRRGGVSQFAEQGVVRFLRDLDIVLPAIVQYQSRTYNKGTTQVLSISIQAAQTVKAAIEFCKLKGFTKISAAKLVGACLILNAADFKLIKD